MGVKLVQGGRVVDPAVPTGRPADLVLDGDIIAAVLIDDTPRPADVETIDATGMLLMPGLVNAHTHSHGNLMKGSADRWTLELLLTASGALGANRDTDAKYVSTALGAAEMLLKGCTACFDLAFEFPAPSVEGMSAIAQAYVDTGMRAVVAPMVGDRTFFESIPGLIDALPEPLRRRVTEIKAAPADATLATLRQLLSDWRFDRSNVIPAVAPTIPMVCSDHFMTGCRDIAREYGARLHTHLSESKVQTVVAGPRFGCSPTMHLDRLGLLGPDMTAAHAVWLDSDDMACLARHGVRVAHNPASNLRLGAGIADVRAMLDAGISVGIGTDGATSADAQNLFEGMRLAALLSRAFGRPHTEWLSSLDALRLVTEGSAAALGLEGRIGRLAPGYQADIAFLDLGNVTYTPLNDAANQIVNCEDSGSVRHVMVAGRLVVRDRRLTTINLAALKARAQTAAETLRTANAPLRMLAESLQPVVGTFCQGLVDTPCPVHRHVGR